MAGWAQEAREQEGDGGPGGGRLVVRVSEVVLGPFEQGERGCGEDGGHEGGGEEEEGEGEGERGWYEGLHVEGKGRTRSGE